MFLKKHKDGYFYPPYQSDSDEAKKIKENEEVRVSRARNPLHHRKFWAIMRCAYANQDKYDDIEIMRQITLMKAGHVVFVDGTDGRQYPIAKSIAFDKCSQNEFEGIYTACLNVLSKEMGITVAQLENESKEYL